MKLIKYPAVSNIAFLEADSNYTTLHLCNGQKVTVAITLKRFEERPEFSLFLRTSRCNLVNPEYIKSKVKSITGLKLVLTDGSRLQVSRRRKMLMSEF